LYHSVKTTVGEEAVLPCMVEKQGNLRVLQWSKEGLGQDYVFYFRDNQPYESFQNPHFKGRVKLSDKEMTNGDMSIVLSNTNLSDAGKYSCKVVMETKTIKTITLEVNEKSELIEFDLIQLGENLTGRTVHGGGMMGD
uniref:Ig-like domain-containing protein n=1 Tax=Cyprinodon variegatus TaxID=28743 RepID=A0A3Q2DZJ2_CYPVA